jgi:hypothetical protein
MINLGDQVQVLNLHPTVARTATANSTGVDIQQIVDQIAIVIDSAAGTGTSPTLDVKIQESSDNSTFTDISGLAFTQITTSASVQKIVLNKGATKRYIRVVSTITGTTPSFSYSVKGYGLKKYPA